MGHVHYFQASIDWEDPKCVANWPQLVQDARLIIEAAGIDLTGNWNPRDELIPPIVNLDQVCFNGLAEDGHDPFIFGPNPTTPSGEPVDVPVESVKTNRKPYNLPIATFLLRAHYLLGSGVSSDGYWGETEWMDARNLCRILWPDEPAYCPWKETVDGVQTAGFEVEMLIAAPSNALTQSDNLTVEGKLRQMQLDQESLLALGPAKSTVSNLDFSHTREWLAECVTDTDGHADCQEFAVQWENLPGVTFRVVDACKRCIVEAPEGSSFVALTYVWGGIDQPKLLEATSSLLSQEGGLDTIWAKIPATVRDAIEVCDKIGERYLWVDSLCIKQDSSRDMRVQIMRMKRIYSSAKCTIVAASADTADVGLLGTSSDGLSEACASESALDHFLQTTPWNSRAWCYQEKVLSHRAIIFTSRGIYLQCQKGTYNAETGLRLAEGKKTKSQVKYNGIGGMLSIPPEQGLESYISAVEYYSSRKLTKQSDRLNAFQAIFQRYRGSIDGMSSGFLYGMPVDGFDQLICFRNKPHSPHLRNTSFPSWSWLGWNGPVSFNRELLAAGRTRQTLQIDNQDWMINSGEALRSKRLRKRAGWNIGFSGGGFPSSLAPYYHEDCLSIAASTLHLSIDRHPVQTRDSENNGLYAVRPAYCSYMDPDPIVIPFAPKVPKGNSNRSSTDTHNLSVHGEHPPDCEAKTPLGYIWLDRDWRDKSQSADCVLRFMAMAGEKRGPVDPNAVADADLPDFEEKLERHAAEIRHFSNIHKIDPGLWNITVLMCLQPVMHGDIKDGADERVQVMDCCITEEEWLRLGAYTSFRKIV
ncbi:Heterokaryon incompatibility protein (HET) domain containing protein [Rhypophila sp. PSN 637]